MDANQTNGIWVFADNSSAYPNAWNSLGASSERQMHRFMCTADGANARFFTNNALWETKAYTSTATASTNRKTDVFADWNSAGNTGSMGRFSVVLAWRGVLGLPQYSALYRNPWQIFQPIKRRIYVGAAGGAPPILSTIEKFLQVRMGPLQ